MDEDGGVEGPLWDAIDSLVANDDCRVLAIGNPDNPQSHFANICKSPLWNTIHISALDTPNLTGEQVPEWMRTLIVTSGWVEECKRDWGEDSPVYVAKVLGRFPAARPTGSSRTPPSRRAVGSCPLQRRRRGNSALTSGRRRKVTRLSSGRGAGRNSPSVEIP